MIARERTPARHVQAYGELESLFSFFAAFPIASFTENAAEIFSRLQRECRRVATMDLRIALIALAHGAKLLTSNRRDFHLVPGLISEDWLADLA